MLISKDHIFDNSVQKDENSIILNSLEFNTQPMESLKYEIEELNNQINSFLYTGTPNSNNVNFDSIEPDA